MGLRASPHPAPEQARCSAEGRDSAPSLPPLRPPTPTPSRRQQHPRRQELGENAVSRSPPRPRPRLRQLGLHVATADLGVCSPSGWSCGRACLAVCCKQVGGRSLSITRGAFELFFIQGGFAPQPESREPQGGSPRPPGSRALRPLLPIQAGSLPFAPRTSLCLSVGKRGTWTHWYLDLLVPGFRWAWDKGPAGLPQKGACR